MPEIKPPQYQDFKGDFKDYVKKATQTVGGSYDSRIAGEQANLPLIQQQYQNLAKTIQDNQMQREGAMKKGAESSIGASRLSNALSGIFSSSENAAVERNTRDDLDTNVANLAANVANTLTSAQTERAQQEQAIQNVIRALQADKNKDIQQTASSLFSSDRSAWDSKQARIINDYWKRYTAQVEADLAKWQKETDQRDYNYKVMMDRYAKERDQMDPELLTGVVNSVMYNEDGTNRSQADVYRDIMQNSSYYKSLGVNPEQLWQLWRDREYGADYGYGLSQADIERMIRERSASTGNAISSGLRSGALKPQGGSQLNLNKVRF